MIEGYAIVFNQKSRIMYDRERKRFFTEIIKNGSVTEELLRSCDIKAVLEHNKQRLLARYNKGGGSLSLEINDYGLLYRFLSPNTVDGDFAVEMISRGDIFGSSFAYYADEKDKSKVEYTMDNGMLLRTVHKIDLIDDISPVIDPAFFGTDVSVRSIEGIEATLNPDRDYLIHIQELEKLI